MTKTKWNPSARKGRYPTAAAKRESPTFTVPIPTRDTEPLGSASGRDPLEIMHILDVLRGHRRREKRVFVTAPRDSLSDQT